MNTGDDEPETPAQIHDRQPTICSAPATSLHLDPWGWVTACTANKRDALGNVAHDDLIELWRGRAADELRSHFTDGGLAPGCDVCRWQLDVSGRESMYARIYDHLEPGTDRSWPQHIEFTMSADCNLACVMCNGSLSSTIRRRREGLALIRSPYGDRFFERLPPILDHLHEAKFLGGEPFLAAENYRVWDLMVASVERPSCHVTTNGTVFSARTAAVLDQLPMSFAVSMDGATASTVERIRAGARLADILTNLDRFQTHVEANGTNLSLTFCLMTENWQEFADFLAFGDERGLRVYVNTVVSPARFSLYRLPRRHLQEVVDWLTAADPLVSRRLGRNLDVWKDHLGRLRAVVDQVEPDRETAGTFSPRPEGASPRPPIHGPADAERLLAAWSGSVQVGRMTADDRDVLVFIDAENVPGVNLAHLLGLGVDELFVALQSAFGRLATSTSVRHAPHGNDRRLEFRSTHHPTEVRLISGADRNATWWRIAVRGPAHGRGRSDDEGMSAGCSEAPAPRGPA